MSVLKSANRKDSERRQTNTNGWQIVYTGFILILLCFFILLTSFASLEESKIARFTQSFTNAVTVFEGGKSIEKGETMLNTDTLLIDKEDQMAQLFTQVQLQSELADLNVVSIQRSKQGVVMTLADKFLFTSGDARFSSAAVPLLQKIARIIKNIKVPVEIEGHSDDRPIYTAVYASNWELSTARAVNVLRYLIEEQRVASNRLSAVGFSSHQPIAKNDSDQNRARNRRVAIVFKIN